MVHGAVPLYDRHVRELSQRTGAEAVLVYGRNQYDKCRALACIHYRSGAPQETLLLGADEDQDSILDHLGPVRAVLLQRSLGAVRRQPAPPADCIIPGSAGACCLLQLQVYRQTAGRS